MAHTDPEILALRALGEHTGSARDDTHTSQCADCQLELERLSHVAGLARRDGPASLEQPPAALWERIAAAVGEDAVPSSLVPAAPDGGPRADGGAPRRGRPVRPRRRGRSRLAVAGAVAGLVIGIGGTAAVAELTRAPASPVVAEIALRPLAQFPQFQGAAGTAVLREAAAAPQLAVSVTAPRRTGFYEVWLLARDGTSMISLGDLNAANTGTFALPGGVDLRFYSRIDVSLQQFNGSPVHSSTSVVRGSLPAGADGRT